MRRLFLALFLVLAPAVSGCKGCNTDTQTKGDQFTPDAGVDFPADQIECSEPACGAMPCVNMGALKPLICPGDADYDAAVREDRAHPNAATLTLPNG